MKNETQIWSKSAGALVAAGALAVGMFGMTGCNGCGSNNPAPITNAANGGDPADANLATTDGSQPTQVMGQSAAYRPQQSSETYGSGQQAPAPIVKGNGTQNEAYNYNTQQNGYYDNSQQAPAQGYDDSAANTYADVEQAPPELPVYEQPPAPDDNDLWTPGYWGYANTGYYWVPGAWVTAPYAGALWTPGYWGGYGGNRYRFHHGFWGRHIGYYGGINYGYGYVGSGYYGGYWNRDHFYYNREVTRVSPRITNVYEHNVVVNHVRYTAVTNNRVSYNGGRGGVNYQPRPYEVAAMHEQHIGPLPAQQQFHQQAALNRANFYADNHGRPAQLALAQPIRTEHLAAPPEVSRSGFGRGVAPTSNGVGPNAAPNQHNEQGAQRLQIEQQRNAPLQEHNQAEQQRGLMQGQHNQAEQQRGLVEQQRNQNEQQRNVMEQQRNQQLAQHNQVEQQRELVQGQHNQQLGGNNNALQQQRAMHGGNEQLQQHVQQMQQNRSVTPQQPRAIQEQARPQPQQQQHFPQQQQHFPQQQPRMEQPRPQINAQPHIEQHAMPQPQSQQHTEAPRAAPAPHMEAPHAAPAAAPHAEAPGGGGGHPGGGGHH